MDKLPTHNVVDARQAIEHTVAALLFLPPYSPDFNPIEKAINQIKTLLKKAAARTNEELDTVIAKAVDIVAPKNARNYVDACGNQVDKV